MKQTNELPAKLAKPAQRALANAGITSLKGLAKFTEKEITALHGIGANALLQIKEAFKREGLSFKK